MPMPRDDGMFYAYAAGRMSWRSNMLRLAYADSGSACKLAQDMVPTAHTQIAVRFRSCFRRATACVPSRWKVLSGEFRRRPTEFVIKLRNPDRVGRRGLFEPREDFSRLHTYAIPWLDSVAVSVAHPLAYPAVGKFSRASSAGGRRHLQ